MSGRTKAGDCSQVSQSVKWARSLWPTWWVWGLRDAPPPAVTWKVLEKRKEKKPTPTTIQLGSKAAGPPDCKSGMSAPACLVSSPASPGSARCSNEGEEMQKHSRGPTAPANVRHHHEKLKFMDLKEKQHLGRNYCHLKGGCRPLHKSEIWKQCLIFFFSDLYSSHDTVV